MVKARQLNYWETTCLLFLDVLTTPSKEKNKVTISDQSFSTNIKEINRRCYGLKAKRAAKTQTDEDVGFRTPMNHLPLVEHVLKAGRLDVPRCLDF